MAYPTDMTQYIPIARWGELLRQAQDTAARETHAIANSIFGDVKVHKEGGLQGVTTSGQVVKFDPSLIKYDEKGLTVAGVPVKGVPSLYSILGKRFETKTEPPAKLADLKKVESVAEKAHRGATRANESVATTDRKFTNRLDGVEVKIKSQETALSNERAEIERIRTGARTTTSSINILLEALAELDGKIAGK